MSLFQFVPDNSVNHNHDFVTWENAFTDEEIDAIVKYGDSIALETATVGGADGDISLVSRSRVGWIENNEETNWIYDRLAYVGRKINGKFYNFDLYGFVEHLQFTIYTEDDKGHYGWHQDMSPTTESARKLSMVLQLSAPEDYEGGTFETMGGSEPCALDKKRGLIAAIPSWRLHRVTPVTKGIRKTLVVWIAGPSFK
jgi:PKHD-type hydroxylase